MMKRLEGWSADTREEENSPQRSVVVGVKLDPLSKELLTWALVKVAQPGDRVVALHVLSSNELFDQDGKSSLLSLVKAFDSVLAVYEGFCNLKQVDLKLKICRGSSVRKVLVREAKAFAASKVILGVAKISRPIGSSASIAKYCGRKLPRDCCVLAVNNGKVVYQREAITISSGNHKDNINRPTSLFSAIQRSLSKNSKTTNLRLLEYPAMKEAQNKKYVNDQEISHILPTDSNQNFGFCVISVNSKPPKKKCSICAPFSILPEDSLCHDPPKSGGLCSDESTEGEASDDSLALVPVQTLEAASSSISLLIREVPELRPGWPLLHRAILPNRQPQDKSMGRQISVVQWAMRLPSRHSMVDHPKPNTAKPDDSTVTTLDGESGAMVLVGDPTSASYGGVIEQFNFVPKELESLQQRCSSTCRLFSYHELAEATCNFSPECLIGKGGSSKVYRGRLPDGKELAVKILKPSEDTIKEFILEIEIITNLSHKNIISLIGFCFEDTNLLLVYDFLSQGSLEENLNGEKEKPVIGWDERYKVALGVAEALDYLHTSSAQPVIHRDVKSSNILLGNDFEPQLSDFGLAQLASTSSTDMTSSDVAGTFGYLAPEYFMYGKVTDKIDVYAFGVVLLELLSGRKPISNEYPKGQESLVMWAMPILQSGKYMKLLDPILGDKFDTEKMEKMVMAVSLCLRRAPRLRPRIGLILKLLQGDEEVTKWAKFQVNSAEKFEGLDEEPYPSSDIQSHLNIALLDVEDDSFSVSSMEPSIHYLTANKSLEDYLQGRWSRSSSFD